MAIDVPSIYNYNAVHDDSTSTLNFSIRCILTMIDVLSIYNYNAAHNDSTSTLNSSIHCILTRSSSLSMNSYNILLSCFEEILRQRAPVDAPPFAVLLSPFAPRQQIKRRSDKYGK